MPQSLSVVYIHLVFSTKERRPFLRDSKLRQSMHAYLGAVSKRLDCAPIVVGGVEDHVHLLARFGRTVTQAEWVKELKGVSNEWIQKEGIADFQWRAGYAGFSVSQSNLEQVSAYIMRQEEHHKKTSFQTSCEPFCGSIKWNGTKSICGIERVAPIHPERSRNPFRVDAEYRVVTQGSSAASQPWALGRNPVGIPWIRAGTKLHRFSSQSRLTTHATA